MKTEKKNYIGGSRWVERLAGPVFIGMGLWVVACVVAGFVSTVLK